MTLQDTVGHCRTLQDTEGHFRALQDTAGHCRTLQASTGHYKALQETTGHCRTLQDTTGHYRTLQDTVLVHKGKEKKGNHTRLNQTTPPDFTVCSPMCRGGCSTTKWVTRARGGWADSCQGAGQLKGLPRNVGPTIYLQFFLILNGKLISMKCTS